MAHKSPSSRPLAVRTLAAICVLAAAIMLPTALAHSTPPSSPLLLNYFTAVAMKNMTLELMQNPTATAAAINVNLGHILLAPCGMLSMHTHIDVDEMVYVLVGDVTASLAYANGTITTATVAPSQAFALTRNLVHTIINPSCTQTTHTLHIFSGVNPASVSVAAAAWALPGSPFSAYGNPSMTASELAAQTFFAYDPTCLARCNLGPQFGQQPASMPNRRM